MSATTDSFLQAPGFRPREIPWRQWLIRKLLYGKDLDRGAKARTRIGLAILAFALVYSVISGRLILFA
ncbi:MAG: penicillin-binding protein 2, partial [Xanthobacteraceae bacterium]